MVSTPEKEKKPAKPRPDKTGEDLDMLNEGQKDPESGGGGSTRYKENYDAA